MASSSRSNGAASGRWSGSMAWVALRVAPPGKKAFPFHRHHVQDELFFVVSGEGEYRFGEKTVPIRSGDLVAAPAGTQAHQLINTGSDDLRYLGISTVGGVDIVDYPDSKKIAVTAGIKNADFKTATLSAWAA